jgi:hypothetical protein
MAPEDDMVLSRAFTGADKRVPKNRAESITAPIVRMAWFILLPPLFNFYLMTWFYKTNGSFSA